jgi:hypothetical protein
VISVGVGDEEVLVVFPAVSSGVDAEGPALSAAHKIDREVRLVVTPAGAVAERQEAHVDEPFSTIHADGAILVILFTLSVLQ